MPLDGWTMKKKNLILLRFYHRQWDSFSFFPAMHLIFAKIKIKKIRNRIIFSADFWFPFHKQIDRMSRYGPKCVAKPLASSYYHLPSNTPARSLDLGIANFGQQTGFVGEMYGAADFLLSVSRPSEADKPVIVELAVSAMEELTRMAQAGEPLWVPGDNKSTELLLNEAEYLSTFRGGIGPKPLGFRTEASRVSAIVFMNHLKLVDIFMDAVCCLFSSHLFFSFFLFKF